MTTFPNTPDSDTIDGTDTEDQFFIPAGETGAGNDVFDGLGGDDSADGGAEDDALFGGSGDDTLRDGLGDDIAFGGSGHDFMVSSGGSDTLRGDGGDDTIQASAGDGTDWLYGGDGDDEMVLGIDGGRMEGGEGDDDLTGLGGSDTMYGGNGNDSLAGELPASAVSDDKLSGDGGNDYVFSLGGNDTLFGGSGVDELVLFVGPSAPSVSVEIDLGDPGWSFDAGSHGVLRIKGFEILTLGAGNDTVTGSEKKNEISAGDGADLVTGEGGNDLIIDGAGNDTVFGGDGKDKISHTARGLVSDQDVFYGGAGVDRFIFGDTGKSVSGAADVIADFVAGEDVIDLRSLRLPYAVVPGPVLNLDWIGTGGFVAGNGPQLRVEDGKFEVDATGDGTADLVVLVTGAGVLVESDFRFL